MNTANTCKPRPPCPQVSVETPLGEDAVPNLMALRRAQREDLNRPVRYQVSLTKGL